MYWLLLIFSCISLFGQDYAFQGTHFVASYLDCDEEAISNPEKLLKAMDLAVESSGAQILDTSSYLFEPDGLTVVYLLSESHASIHTYPEHKACFVDLFTCGSHCSHKEFDAALRKFLQPKKAEAKVLIRDEKIESKSIQ